MSESFSLNVKSRTETGKGPNRRLRQESMVPGIFYNSEGENIQISAVSKELRKVLQKAGYSRLVNLNINDEAARPTLIWKVQHHPFKNEFIHVDFYGVDMDKEITVSIPVEVKGRAKGVVQGGKLEVYHERINVTCLPGIIPEKVVLDVTPLTINSFIGIKEIELPEGVSAVFTDNFAVVGVILPKRATEAAGEDSEAE